MLAHPTLLFASPSPPRLTAYPFLDLPLPLHNHVDQRKPAFETLRMDIDGCQSYEGRSLLSAPASASESAAESSTASPASATAAASIPAPRAHNDRMPLLSAHENSGTLSTSSDLGSPLTPATVAPLFSCPSSTLTANSDSCAPLNFKFDFGLPSDSTTSATNAATPASMAVSIRQRESKYAPLMRRFQTARPLEQNRARRAAAYAQGVKERSSELRFERQAETALHRSFIDDRKDWVAEQLRLAEECQIDPDEVDVEAEFVLSGHLDASGQDPSSQISVVESMWPAYDLPPMDRDDEELVYLAQLDENSGLPWPDALFRDDLEMVGGVGYASSDVYEEDARDIELELLEAVQRVEGMDLS